jgi:hypothetical protein
MLKLEHDHVLIWYDFVMVGLYRLLFYGVILERFRDFDCYDLLICYVM